MSPCPAQSAPLPRRSSTCGDPDSPGGLWFGVERVILNPVVDGLFYHVVTHEGRSWPHYGRFIRLDCGHAIEHTWVSEATRGLESIVTITLASRGDRTEVTLHHANVPDDEMGRVTKKAGPVSRVPGERFEKAAVQG